MHNFGIPKPTQSTRYFWECQFNSVYSHGVYSHSLCARVCFPGRVIQCEIADNLYWENHPQVFLACAVPSSLPEATLQAAYKMREEVAQKLISFGMDNCFFNIEVFGMKDGSVKVKHAIFEVISKHTRVCDVIQTDEGGNCQSHSKNYA